MREARGDGRMAYCICGDLEIEHPTNDGCAVFRRIADHEQVAALLLKDISLARRQPTLENVALEPGGKVRPPKSASERAMVLAWLLEPSRGPIAYELAARIEKCEHVK